MGLWKNDTDTPEGKYPILLRRIQKKWTKRFGVVLKPCMWRVSPRAVGLPGVDYIVADYIVAHPVIAAQLRAHVARMQQGARDER